MKVMEIKLKALTPLWTGGVDQRPDRLHETGLIGSIRWWFEVLVRGLGGEACDPTVKAGDVRCPDKDGKHCVACELFGCTGWARKFRLMVVDENGKVIQNQIQANQIFTLKFIPLRPIRPEEWCLLDLTLRLIAQYGAIGGKTVLKPSDEPGRANAFHHRDFGLISVKECPNNLPSCTREQLEEYIRQERWRKNIPSQYEEDGCQYDYSWASLKNFWCVKGRYLARQNFRRSDYNRVLGRHMHKNRAQDLWDDTPVNRWLAGRQQESKKIFSFKHPTEDGRTFGFVKPDLMDFEEIKRRLTQVWPGFNPSTEFISNENDHILKTLLSSMGGRNDE